MKSKNIFDKDFLTQGIGDQTVQTGLSSVRCSLLKMGLTWFSICWLCVACMFTSCSLNIPPADQYSDPDAIVDVQNARSLLASAYIAYPRYEYELSTLGPDFCPTSLTGKDITQKNTYLWQDNVISSLSQGMWLEYYNTIAICDVLLERLPNVAVEKETEQQEKDAIGAEATMLRAMCYFNLLRLYAPAYDRNPQADGIILKTRVGVEFPARTSIAECTQFIRDLLTEAVKVSNAPQQNGWLSQTAGYYLLAELELYAGNYAEAARYAEQVISKAEDRFFTDKGYANLWEKNSSEERIFAFFISSPIYTSLQYDAEEGDYFMVSPKVVYGKNDYRANYAVFPMKMDDAERPLLGKYNRNNKEGKGNAYLNVFRYAGAYFIAAEAYSRLDGQSAKALSTVNHYLAQCGAEPLDASLTGKALSEAILVEKLKEFVGEGISYFDWKRTRQSMVRYNRWGTQEESSIRPDDYRWTFPIPASEYKFNENVTQNDGWPLNRDK